MTQGPWSVKGIDPRARTVAREKAQRRGITLGQYLNTLLLDDGDEESVSVMFDEPASLEKVEEPDELQSITDEIDHLSQRLEAAQERAAKAITGVDRSILDLQGRVEESSKSNLEAVERVAQALKEIQATQTALRERVQLVESDNESRASISALHDLEASLERLARNVEARAALDAKIENIDNVIAEAVESSSKQINSRVGQIDERIAKVQNRMDGAIERINEASNRFETFESRTERSVADTAKLVERALDANTSRSKAISKELAERVDSIENQTRGAVNSLSDAVSRIIDRLSTAEDSSETALRTIEESVTGIDERFSRLESETGNDIERLESSFQKRLDILAESLAKPMQSVREDVEQRLEHALQNNQPEEIERLAATIQVVQERLDASEDRQADALVSMSKQVERLSQAIDTRLASLEAGDSASIDGLREEMLDLTQRIEERIAFIETDRRMANGGLDDLRRQIDSIDQSIDERIASLSATHGHSVDDRIAGIASDNEKLIESRIADLTNTHGQSIRDLSSTVAELTEQLEAVGHNDSGQDFGRLTDKIDERIRESERRSADAITQIGEQVARVAERLQAQHAESLKTLETRLATSERSHRAKLNEALSGMTQRLQEIGEETTTALQPFHKKMSALAQRIADIEDATAPPRRREPQQTAPTLVDLDDEDADEMDDLLIVDTDEDVDFATNDVVGTEPPPFDDSADSQLFDKAGDAPSATRKQRPPSNAMERRAEKNRESTPANNIDDLLDVDDVVLQPDEPDAMPAPKASSVPEDLPQDADFMTRARQAARSGSRTIAANEPAARKGVSKGPLMASAALAIAVAGGGAWSLIRGKQDDAASGDAFARQDPSEPLAPEGDPGATESVLFNSTTPAEPGESEATGGEDSLFANSAIVESVAEPQSERPPTLAESVAAGDPVALYDQAQELLQTGEKARAVTMLKQAASDGLVIASYRLAKLNERGEGVPRDMAAARRWTEQAAIGGNVRAMHDLAVFYAEGDSGPQSYAAAVEWFRQASDLGLVDSQYNLAVLYEQGLGVSEDRSEAAYWFEVAGRGGDEDALRRARALLSDMPPPLAEQIRRRARAYNPKRSDAMANGDLGVRPWDQPTSSQIAEMQRLLNRLGYAAGEPDGQVGARTAEAIRAFEASNGVEPRGDATLTLLRQLRIASPA